MGEIGIIPKRERKVISFLARSYIMFFIRFRSSIRIERRPVTAKAEGSIPFGTATIVSTETGTHIYVNRSMIYMAGFNSLYHDNLDVL